MYDRPGKMICKNSGNIKGKKNAKHPVNGFLATLVIMLVPALAVSIIFAFTGCTKSEVKNEGVAESSIAAETGNDIAENTAEASETVESVAEERETPENEESATESMEVIPAGILELIETADNYYSSGEYGLAKSSYRKAEIAINESGLSDGAKQDLIDSFNSKYEKSLEIIEAAMMHYSNAMQLQYETRYEEAKKEFEAALALYPQYTDAREAYENLKTVMGLE